MGPSSIRICGFGSADGLIRSSIQNGLPPHFRTFLTSAGTALLTKSPGLRRCGLEAGEDQGAGGVAFTRRDGSGKPVTSPGDGRRGRLRGWKPVTGWFGSVRQEGERRREKVHWG